MYCCGQCQGIEDLFSEKLVRRELADYRKHGPRQTTRMLIQAIEAVGKKGQTLLDIGGGIGAIQYAFLSDGVEKVTSVDASSAYLSAAQSEAQRRGLTEKIDHRYGNYVDLAETIAPADIVTLDRVICCYDDMENLVRESALKAKKVYGVVYPRDGWWVKLGMWILNLVFRLQKNPYRSFIHSTREVEAIIESSGLRRQSREQTLVWQVVVYTR